MSLGLASGVVTLVPSDPAWPALFADESARLHGAVAAAGLPPLALEHVGSTAVPGLAAKPVLDLMGGAPAGIALLDYVPALVAAGYVHRGPQGIPEREFFRRGDPRAQHLHLVAHDGTFWREHLAFRDALRADPARRDAYAALKRALAERFPRDREAYTEGKTAFVRAVVAEWLAVAGATARHGAAPDVAARPDDAARD